MTSTLFAYHNLNDTGRSKCDQITNHFDNLLGLVESMCEQGRELAIVRTKLEEACMYAKKSVAMAAANQKRD